MDEHTHTLATSQRDLPQSSFGREKTHQKVSTSTKSEEKPQKVHIVASTEETMKEHSILASNTSSFNGCLHLT